MPPPQKVVINAPRNSIIRCVVGTKESNEDTACQEAVQKNKRMTDNRNIFPIIPFTTLGIQPECKHHQDSYSTPENGSTGAAGLRKTPRTTGGCCKRNTRNLPTCTNGTEKNQRNGVINRSP
jgi:hypothetical protein